MGTLITILIIAVVLILYFEYFEYLDYRSEMKSKLVFDISYELFVDLIHDNCFYCGQSANEKRNGVDRIDNTLGYSKENVVPCCFKCNQLKGKLSVNEFLSHIVKILEYAIK